MLPRPSQAPMQSSSSSSPLGTPPPSVQALPVTPSINETSTSNVPPSSPPASSTNRFGLAMTFMQRRPRGFTASSAGRQSPSSPNGASPNSELPPSPGGGERERTSGYGFPTLRRQLSKRTNPPGSVAGDATASLSARSNSQPPLGPSVSHRSLPSTRPGSANGASVLPTVLSESSNAEGTGQNPRGATSTSNGGVGGASTSSSNTPMHKFRLVPHLETSRSLHFDPIDRDVSPFTVLRVGRFTDRSSHATSHADPFRVAFKSKVVSRSHAEIWCDDSGKFFIKDTKSSSGTFLNHIRLTGPGTESRAFPLKDGDVLQLGVDYAGGSEEIYRCVKMRLELNRSWQRGINTFNTNALAQLRALGGGSGIGIEGSGGLASASIAKAPVSSVTDCCICLYPVTVCQALFIAPCSHVTHFKCIRPLVQQNYPGFSCPLCRTYADLEADVEVEWEPELLLGVQPETVKEESTDVIEDSTPADTEVGAGNTTTTAGRESIIVNPVEASHLPGHSSLGDDVGDDTAVPSATVQHEHATETAPSLSSPSDPVSIPEPSSSNLSEGMYGTSLDLATPLNSTFLSTLADSGVFSRQRNPMSLDQALDGLNDRSSPFTAGPSSRVLPTVTDRHSSGSEDETDGTREYETDEGKRKGPGPVSSTLTPVRPQDSAAEEARAGSMKEAVGGGEEPPSGNLQSV